MNIILNVLIVAVLVGSGFYKFIAAHRGNHDNGLECNQLVAMHEIVNKGLHKMDVPRTVDAVFINSVLPRDYNMTYTLQTQTDSATLYDNEAHVVEKYRFLDNGLIVLF